MTASTSHTDASSHATPDAIALLKADHRAVKALFAAFGEAKDKAHGLLAAEICAALTVHAQIEEEILYPAARTALGAKGAEMLDEALVEHGTAKDLIAKIETSGPGMSLFTAWVNVLGEYIQNHVKEEEDHLFPKLRSSGMDLNAVGAKLASRKAELTGAHAHDSVNSRHAGVKTMPPASGAQRPAPKPDGAKSARRL